MASKDGGRGTAAVDGAAEALAPSTLRAGVKLQAGAPVRISVVGKSGRSRPGGGSSRALRDGDGDAAAGPSPSAGGSQSTGDASPGELSEPSWSSSQLEHQAEVALQVKAPGLDGRKVRFLVEHEEAGEWKPYATVAASVQDGIATVSMQTDHPVFSPLRKTPATAKEISSARSAQLRFHAELLPAGG